MFPSVHQMIFYSPTCIFVLTKIPIFHVLLYIYSAKTNTLIFSEFSKMEIGKDNSLKTI